METLPVDLHVLVVCVTNEDCFTEALESVLVFGKDNVSDRVLHIKLILLYFEGETSPLTNLKKHSSANPRHNLTELL